MFWIHFAHYFPRNLVLFTLLTACVVGLAWLIVALFPALSSWLALLLATVAFSLLGTVGRVLILMVFKI